MRTSQAVVLALGTLAVSVSAKFNANCNNNVAIYWGQDSAGVQNLPVEGRLMNYCKDSSADIMIISFVNQVNSDGSIDYNFANHDDLNQIGSDIKYCQSQGKTVMISVGGAIGSYQLTSTSQATALANTLWDRFLGGNGDRVFGNGAVLDGIDLDIEGTDGGAYYDVVANRIHKLGGLVSAAPECPDNHRMTKALPTGWFDFLNVQFYNNYCQLSNYPNINYDYWENYAKNVSPNKNVKILIGGVADPADGPNGYVSLSTWTTIFQNIREKYTSYGGVMEFEASVAFIDSSNHVYAPSLSKAVKSGSSCGSSHSSTTSKSTTSKSTTTKTSSSTKTTKTTSTKTTSSTKTKTSTSSPTSTPGGSCPVSGGSCTSGYSCNGNSIAQCDNGKWVLISCPSGTTCKKSGGSAYCDYGSSSSCNGASLKVNNGTLAESNSKGRKHARDFH